MSGDCLGHGAPCRALALSGEKYDDPRWRQGSAGFKSAEHEHAMDASSAPPECKTTATSQCDGHCHDFLRPHVRLCDGRLSVDFVWLGQDVRSDGCDGQGPAASKRGCININYVKQLVRALGSDDKSHLLLFGGGLHVSFNNAPGFFKTFRGIFDLIPNAIRIFVGWVHNDARTKVTPQIYHAVQSNFKARRFDHIVNGLLHKYFEARKNPTVWLDPYQFTAKIAQNESCELTARDGTHYGLCVNAMKSKILMNAICNRLGAARCKVGNASRLTMDIDCELYKMPSPLRKLMS